MVGAAASFGSEALRLATVLKLARALWIFPLVVAAAAWMRWRRGSSTARLPAFPWFIVAFVAAAAVRSLAGEGALPLLEGVVAVARRLLVLTLLLIGAGMSAGALRRAGWRPLAMGVLLWAAVSVLTLGWVLRGVAL